MSGVGAGELADLEERRRFLLESLRDLEREREAGDIEEADYLSLRDDYTARAAAVLQEIEQHQAPATGAARTGRRRATTGNRARRRSRRRAPQSGRPRVRAAPQRRSGRVSPNTYIVAVLVTIVVGAGIGVVAFSDDRPVEPQPSPSGSSPNPEVAQALAEAHQLEQNGRAADALKLYDAVVRDDPDNVEAHTYRGWLLARANLVDQAMESLDRAVALDPRYPDAHFFRGMVLFRQRNDPAAAIPEFEAFLANNPPPDSVPSVQEVLNQARQAVGG